MGAGDMFACILPNFTAVCCLLVCRGLFVSFYYLLTVFYGLTLVTTVTHTAHRTLTTSRYLTLSDPVNILRLSLAGFVLRFGSRLSVSLEICIKLTYSLYASSMHAHEHAN